LFHVRTEAGCLVGSDDRGCFSIAWNNSTYDLFDRPFFSFFSLPSFSALILSSNTLAGSSFGSCGTSSPRKALARRVGGVPIDRLTGTLVLGFNAIGLFEFWDR
jgi:hypothetical protein